MSTVTIPKSSEPRAGRGATNPWLVLVIACLAQFMVVLDVSIVNVALPSMQRDLHFSLSSAQWVVNAYALTLAAFLLTSGAVADLITPVNRPLRLWCRNSGNRRRR